MLKFNPLTGKLDIVGGGDISGFVPYTGATANLLLGANKLQTPAIFPASDSTTAIQINKADGTTNVLNIDTTNSRIGIGTVSPVGTLHVEKSIYTSNMFVINNGPTGVPNAFPANFTPTFVVNCDKSIGSRPLFFGYESGDTWDAFITIGAAGGFSTMALDMGAGSTVYTALQNYGSTLRIGGGEDGNFTDVEFRNNGSIILNASTKLNGTIASQLRMDASGAFKMDAPGIVGGRFTIDTAGNVGIGVTSPTAKLHLKAGTASANTAPLKFISGVDLTTAEAGAMEYDGTNLHFTAVGTLRENIHFGARGGATLTAGITSTITDANAKTTSIILIQSTSAAATLLGIYVSTKNNGTFVLTHTAAAGTETIYYVIIN